MKIENFCAFDYGNAEDNQAHYGQDTPPDYDLTKVTTPVALYWSEADWLAQPAVSLIRQEALNMVFRAPCIRS